MSQSPASGYRQNRNPEAAVVNISHPTLEQIGTMVNISHPILEQTGTMMSPVWHNI